MKHVHSLYGHISIFPGKRKYSFSMINKRAVFHGTRFVDPFQSHRRNPQGKGQKSGSYEGDSIQKRPFNLSHYLSKTSRQLSITLIIK